MGDGKIFAFGGLVGRGGGGGGGGGWGWRERGEYLGRWASRGVVSDLVEVVIEGGYV
jgi:hypothetical protein